MIPGVSSENRDYLPIDYLNSDFIIGNLNFALYDAPLWNMALIASRVHLVWIATVCGKLETRYRYSNTLGWNTFPVPQLTEKNKADLTSCAENILLAREAHFRRPLRISTKRAKCRTTCAALTTGTTRCSSASTWAAASGTTRNGWRSYSTCTAK